MKLLVVTHFYASHGGGIESVAGQLVDHWLSLDSHLNIEWCAAQGDTLPPKKPRLRRTPLRVWNGIEKATGVPVPLPSLSALGKLWRAVRRAEVVHFHDFAYPTHAILSLFCRCQRKPYFVTQHIGFVPFQSAALRAILTAVNRVLGRAVLRGAQRVVFVSDEVRRYFEEAGAFEGVPHQPLTLPNGVDTQIYHPVDEPTRRALREKIITELDLDPARPVALFVGRFVEKKGIPLLLELSRQLPQIQWLFAGRGPLDPGASAAPNIRVVQGRRGAALADLYRSADFLILPSQGEGFPLVVQEALACGTPVLVESTLATSLPAVAPWLSTEKLGETDDLERWTRAAQTLLESASREDEANRYARASFAAQQWNWNQTGSAYLSLFETTQTRAETGKHL